MQQKLTPYEGPAFTLVSTGLLFVAGYGLFLLKIKKLRVYASIEILFALISCYVAIGKIEHEFTMGSVLIICASLYLVVRGLDNRYKGSQRTDSSA